MAKDLMIDFETLGTDPNTTVISVGAVFFDLDTGTLGPDFYMAFEIEDQMKKGRSITASTLKWWMSQSGGAKKVFHEKAKPTEEVLKTFAAWVTANGSISKIQPWGNGSTFDISIMEDLLRSYDIKVPWLYYNVFDLRTFKRFIANGAKVNVEGTAHNALDDAKAQALYVIEHDKFFKGMLAEFAKIAQEKS